jgi:hypothetical protein
VATHLPIRRKALISNPSTAKKKRKEKEGDQWEGGGDKERGSEGEYGGNILHTCMKMEK